MNAFPHLPFRLDQKDKTNNGLPKQWKEKEPKHEVFLHPSRQRARTFATLVKKRLIDSFQAYPQAMSTVQRIVEGNP